MTSSGASLFFNSLYSFDANICKYFSTKFSSTSIHTMSLYIMSHNLCTYLVTLKQASNKHHYRLCLRKSRPFGGFPALSIDARSDLHGTSFGSGIHANDVDGVALCQMFSRVISTTIRAPKYPLSGHAPDEFPIVARIPILSQS